MPSFGVYEQPEVRDSLIGLRRELHRHPEIGFQEHWTSAHIAERLAGAGIEVTRLAGTGLIGTVHGGKPGRTVLIRAELDALPIEEVSDQPYRSQQPGAMHACGHDAHMAMATVVAERFARIRDELPGIIKFAFQPAEEIAGGAKQMIEEGAMDGPHVDRTLSVHVWQDLPVGTVGVAGGPIWAAVDDLTFTVRGKSGHGAMPHQAIDAVVVAAQIVNALQTVVSRTRSPFEPAVLTIGSIHGGTAWNIIADRVEMRGTLRTFDGKVRERLLGRISALATGVAESMDATCEIDDRYGAPTVVNDVEVAGLVRDALLPVAGEEHVITHDPSAGGDDFAYFSQIAPGCLFLVGSANESKGLDKGHHNPSFDIDEQAMVIGAGCLEAALLKLLGTA